jgi:hypothetical protein
MSLATNWNIIVEENVNSSDRCRTQWSLDSSSSDRPQIRSAASWRGADIRHPRGPALMAPRTAHFEEVREIRSEINIYPDLSQPLVEIPALIACAVPQEVSSREVQEVVLQNQHSHWVEQIGICEVAGERCIIVAQGGRQQQRPFGVTVR